MPTNLDPADRAKFASAEGALAYIEDGMRLGLGTGSTAAWLVRMLAEKVQAEKMDITCVPTSSRTKDLAESLGLKVTTLDDVGWLDLTIDGADEFDPELNLIKGGGGAWRGKTRLCDCPVTNLTSLMRVTTYLIFTCTRLNRLWVFRLF